VAGITACPAVEGATNWFSNSYYPATGLFYLQALEKCNIYKKAPGKWEAGKSYYDGTTDDIPNDPGQKVLRALKLETGEIVWEHPQVGPADSWGGVLSTEGGLVFVGEDGGAFAALDARSGKRLWHFQTNQLWKASPMTYSFDGKQYVAVAAGGAILAFSLP
jgi:alcohol dehydrogenase (cytochrome c)